MVDEAKPSAASCPDLEQWSAYVEASAQERLNNSLGEHLSRCDHCFSAVAVLEHSLASTDGEQEVTPPDLQRRAAASGKRPERRLFWYAAAAAAAMVLLGSWYANRQEGDNLIPAGEQLAEQPVPIDRVFGFAQERDDDQLRHCLVVFAGFEDQSSALPGWSQDLFDHIDTGRTRRMEGTVLGKRYLASRVDSPQLFARSILQQVDADVDLRRYDNDGADLAADSGDDDGVVDYVFLVLSGQAGSLLHGTGVTTGLGLERVFASADRAHDGDPVRVLPGATWGCVVREGTLESTAKAMADGFQASSEARP